MAKLLLIEDEPDQSHLIKIRLEANGYHVMTANRAEEGIILALDKKPDLILMDMVLPGMHGLAATARIKKIPEIRYIPIIALTAMSMPDFKRACFDEGICAFVKKPFEPGELLDKIEKNIDVKAKPTIEPEDLETEYESTSSDHSIDKQEIGLVPEEKAITEPVERKIKEEQTAEDGVKKEKKTVENEINRTGIPKKILVVDDDPDLLKMLAMRLLTCGYEVVAATDAQSAVKQAHRAKPDLILLDMMLPGGGGEGVFENLKTSLTTMLIPVVFISAMLSPRELEVKAQQLGAEGAIPKPFEPEELIAKVKGILGE